MKYSMGIVYYSMESEVHDLLKMTDRGTYVEGHKPYAVPLVIIRDSWCKKALRTYCVSLNMESTV